jgi:hypothetical protein
VDRESEKERPADWFARAINMSTESLAWGFESIPQERRSAAPPQKLGEWTVARQLFHILYYEREVALPSVRLWVGGEYPTFEDYDEAGAWSLRAESGNELEELRSVRDDIIETLRAAKISDWHEALRTPWGEKTLYWVASKTYQHGIEHLSGVLRAAMLWDHYASRQGTRSSKEIE